MQKQYERSAKISERVLQRKKKKKKKQLNTELEGYDA